jgi:hypothetical protein
MHFDADIDQFSKVGPVLEVSRPTIYFVDDDSSYKIIYTPELTHGLPTLVFSKTHKGCGTPQRRTLGLTATRRYCPTVP